MSNPNNILEDLNDRSREVFRAVVESYLESGGPVGSRTLTRSLSEKVSAATVRNVMQDLEFLGLLDSPHAIIAVEPEGENQIILFPGANRVLNSVQLEQALAQASVGDILVMQNETNLQAEAAQLGRRMGLRVCYAAAPFDADAVQAVLPYLDFLILNEVEAQQLQQDTGKTPGELGVKDVIITLGSKGARHIDGETGAVLDVPALPVMRDFLS